MKREYYLNKKGKIMKRIAFFGKLNGDWAACLKNAVSVLVA
jgi:hypothetical protein